MCSIMIRPHPKGSVLLFLWAALSVDGALIIEAIYLFNREAAEGHGAGGEQGLKALQSTRRG